MKKVLLSLSMLAAVMTANAQKVGVGIYDDFSSVNDIGTASGGIFYFGDAIWTQFYPNFADSTTTAPKHLLRRNGSTMEFKVDKAANYNLTGTQTDDNAKYSPFGVNFGDSNGDGTGNPFYIDISGKKTLSIDLKTYAPISIRVQLQDVDGHSIEATAGTKTSWAFNVTTTMKTYTLDVSNAVSLDYSDACTGTKPCEIPGFEYEKVKQILFFVDPGHAGTDPQTGSVTGHTDGTGFQASTFSGLVTMDNLKLGTTNVIGLGTQAAAANIGSSALYPNPTSGVVNANLTLQNPASVSMIVTDMVGKQVTTQNFGTISSLNGVQVFDASALAKGMYTVTYVLDGTPAKTELVVVK